MPESAEQNPGKPPRELIVLLGAWLLLAIIVVLFAKQNLSVPGLYYDEAIFGGMAKDFLVGPAHGQHMPDHESVTLAGRPFPLFVQTYLGALKCWMLIPAFKLFGVSVAVLRSTNVFWALAALLLLMIGTWRWLGFGVAMITGVLLAFDPTFFFTSVLDWGAVVPSLVCRCACFFFAVCWIQTRKLPDAFLVGLFAGLAFFNKADFAVLLAGVAAAALLCYRKEIFGAVRTHSSAVALACLGFALGGGPMLLKLPRMVMLTVSNPNPNASAEFSMKLKTLLSIYDGSYFYRLMNVGGVFERMFDGVSGPKHLLGVILLVACLSFAAVASRRKLEHCRAVIFLLLAAILITLGVFALPYATRIHHAQLVYPLPQLVLAAVIVTLWKTRLSQTKMDYLRPVIIAILLVALLTGELRGIAGTERLIQETAGRGRWSKSFDEFCHDIENRSDLRIICLDWGFNEQLLFLTNGPQISEPFWQFAEIRPALSPNPSYVYVAHASDYSVFQYDLGYLDQLHRSGANAEITPYLDRQGGVAFYTIHFPSQ